MTNTSDLMEENKDSKEDVHIPLKGRSEEEILEEIWEAKEEDINFSSGRIFGSMCSEPLDIARDINAEFIESNLGNENLYRGTKILEHKVHRAIGLLIHFYEDEGLGSYSESMKEVLSVGGGTEGNILALWQARNDTGKRKVLLPKSAHFSFKKAVNLLDMEAVFLSLDEKYRLNPADLEEKIDEDVALVVAIAGSTELGQVDPIPDIANIVGDTEETYLHVDAAFGGMVLPFLNDKYKEDLPQFDFRVDDVDSMVIDPHKMGLSPVPLGLYYSNKKSEFSISSPYLSGKSHKTIRGTRSSSPIPAFWATLNRLGLNGYEEKISRCMQNTKYLVKEMRDIGYNIIIDPVMNIASFHHDEPKGVVKEMRDRRYNISRTVTPPGLRFVIMPHVNKTSIDDIVEEMKDFI